MESNDFLNDNEQEKYFNEDFICKILENGSDEELEKVRGLHGWSEEEVNLYCHFSRIRRTALDNMNMELERRLKENPVPTKEELAMGAYLEKIEPQVREAVLVLRSKGYSTYYSGFDGFGDEQIVKLEAPILPTNEILKLVPALAELGAKLQVSNSEISFQLEREVSITELTELWAKIAAAVPDSGYPAPDCQLSSAKFFRKALEGSLSQQMD